MNFSSALTRLRLRSCSAATAGAWLHPAAVRLPAPLLLLLILLLAPANHLRPIQIISDQDVQRDAQGGCGVFGTAAVVFEASELIVVGGAPGGEL